MDPEGERQHHHHYQSDGEIDQTGQHRGDRQNQARKINFGDHVLVVHDDVGAIGEGERKICPRNERGEIKNRIRESLRRQFGQAAEKDGEHAHSHERLQDYPQDADGGLLVADFDVAHGEEIEELAILPSFGEAQLEPAARRLNAHYCRRADLGLRRRGRFRREGEGRHYQ